MTGAGFRCAWVLFDPPQRPFKVAGELIRSGRFTATIQAVTRLLPGLPGHGPGDARPAVPAAHDYRNCWRTGEAAAVPKGFGVRSQGGIAPTRSGKAGGIAADGIRAQQSRPLGSALGIAIHDDHIGIVANRLAHQHPPAIQLGAHSSGASPLMGARSIMEGLRCRSGGCGQHQQAGQKNCEGLLLACSKSCFNGTS